MSSGSVISALMCFPMLEIAKERRIGEKKGRNSDNTIMAMLDKIRHSVIEGLLCGNRELPFSSSETKGKISKII